MPRCCISRIEAVSRISPIANAYLELNDQPVMGALFGDVVEIGEHFAAEMREDNALGPDFRPVLHDVGIVEMVANGLLKEVALRDEKVGAICKLRDVLGPLAVARVGDHFSRHLDAQ